MSLLNVKNLTVRFGGLTAVSAVDIQVATDQIFSIIGPNGAGKTTVFNAITGIYEPTSGTIEFQGHPLRRPFSWRVVAACVLVGLATGLAGLLASVNVDLLWRATIKRNYRSTHEPFSSAAAWHDLLGYLRGDLALEQRRDNRWAVASADGSLVLDILPTREEAEQRRQRLTGLLPLAALSTSAQQLSAGELAQFKNPAEAQAMLAQLAEVDATAAARRRNGLVGLLVGIVLGAAGSWTVWNRWRRTPDVVARYGISRTFQNIRLFQNMTVAENVLTAMHPHFRAGVVRMALRTPGLRREEAAGRERALALLDFVGLKPHADKLAKNLPYGDQRRLEIARALASEPRLILLDEPAAGMNPAESADLTKLIGAIRRRAIAVLLIEHHMKVVMGISDRIAVLDYGVKIAEGTPHEVKNNPEVIKAYLGSEEVS